MIIITYRLKLGGRRVVRETKHPQQAAAILRWLEVNDDLATLEMLYSDGAAEREMTMDILERLRGYDGRYNEGRS